MKIEQVFSLLVHSKSIITFNNCSNHNVEHIMEKISMQIKYNSLYFCFSGDVDVDWSISNKDLEVTQRTKLFHNCYFYVY